MDIWSDLREDDDIALVWSGDMLTRRLPGAVLQVLAARFRAGAGLTSPPCPGFFERDGMFQTKNNLAFVPVNTDQKVIGLQAPDEDGNMHTLYLDEQMVTYLLTQFFDVDGLAHHLKIHSSGKYQVSNKRW